MRKCIFTFCALMCALTLSGCWAIAGPQGDIDGSSVDGTSGNDTGSVDTETSGNTDTSGTDAGSDTGVAFDCALCKSDEKCIMDSNPRCEVSVGDGYLVITSTEKGAKVFLNGDDTGKTTPVTLTVAGGTHQILLMKDGYLSWNKGDDEWDLPLNITVKADASADAKINLYPDLTAYWKDLETTETGMWKMKIDGPSDECPNGGPYVLSHLSRLCFETPTTFSICKGKSSICTWHGTAELLEDGKKLVAKGVLLKMDNKPFEYTFKNKGL